MCKHSVNKFSKRLLPSGLSEVLHNFAHFEQEVIERELLFGKAGTPAVCLALVFPNPENGQKSLLRNVHSAYSLHAFFAFFLLFQSEERRVEKECRSRW